MGKGRGASGGLLHGRINGDPSLGRSRLGALIGLEQEQGPNGVGGPGGGMGGALCSFNTHWEITFRKPPGERYQPCAFTVK